MVNGQREAYEINLDPALPKKLDIESFITVGSKSFVTPVAATLDGRPELKTNPYEVEKILHVHLPSYFSLRSITKKSGNKKWATKEYSFFELIGDTVWGATGSMIKQFLTIIHGIQRYKDIT